MIKHVWSLICTKSSIDSQTNNVSIFEILEQINLSGPTIPPEGFALEYPFQLIVLWSREEMGSPAQGEARARISNPSGQQIGDASFPIDLTTTNRHRSFINFPGIPVSEPGIFKIYVDLKEKDAWVNVAEVPLEIAINPTLDS